MNHLKPTLALVALVFFAACSGPETPGDGGPDTGTFDCTDQQDGTACGAGQICLGGVCTSSGCGDGFLDPAAGEECEDGNDDPFDGCRPDNCQYTCHAGECADTIECNGAEECSAATHVCEDATDLVDGTDCALASDTGVCRAGECVEMGCGNSVVDGEEHCDDGNTTPGDGCENDCVFTCEVDDTFLDNTWYLDCDADGYAAQDPDPRTQCLQPAADACGGEWTLRIPVAGASDCDDTNIDVRPGAVETCDGVDNDCAGGIDDGVLLTFFLDNDGDGHGNPSSSMTGCMMQSGYASVGDDCNDSCDDCYPGSTEICDGADNDCNSATDEGDNGCGGACALVNAPDSACDGPDTDSCEDDTYVCSGTNATVCSAGANGPEVCGGGDEDCDGTIDEGGNGCGGACTLSNPVGRPCDGADTDMCLDDAYQCAGLNDTACSVGANDPEVCGGGDENCNGTIDEGSNACGGACSLTNLPGAPCDGGDTDLCVDDAYMCAGINATVCSVGPSNVEVCGGGDDDCDGTTDEGSNTCGGACTLAPPVGMTCDGPDTDLCADDTYVCSGLNGTVCGTGTNTPEVCGGGDEDCDTAIDEGFAGQADCSAPLGCETNTTNNPSHCGTCGHTCGTMNSSSSTCVTSACQFACIDPYRHCDGIDANGCETNIGTDPNNCGACGHSCLGGACVSGNCQPILMAGNPAVNTGLQSLYGIAVSGTNLYGTNWYRADVGVVYRLPTAGGPLNWVVTVSPTPANGCAASPMVNDGTGRILYGYFRDEPGCPARGIWQIDTSGAISFVTTATNINLMAADANYVYYTELWSTGIWRWTRATGARTYYLGGNEISALFAEAGSIYFSNVTARTIYAADATTLGSPTPLVTTVNPPTFVRTDASYLYYHDGGRFYRLNKLTGGAAQDITPTTALPGPIGNFLVDATNVYYIAGTTAGTQRWYWFRKDGTSAAARSLALVSATDTYAAVTQDTTQIYWTTYGTTVSGPFSAVYRVAKP